MAYIGAEPLPGQNREVDDISSSFNGSTTAFTLQVSSSNVSPETANNIIVSLGGVIQNPGTDYTIAASTITFTTAPTSGLSFFGLILGAGINTATVADQTIGTSKILDNSVTADKLAHTSVTAGSYTTADITVDAQGRITSASNGTIASSEIANDAVGADQLASNSVVSASIVDGSIVNGDINASAAIAGTKISPDFGSQNVISTGTSNALGTTTIKGGSNSAARLLFENTTSVRTNFIGLDDDDDTMVISVDAANQGSGSHLDFKMDGTQRTRLTSDGKFLMGNTGSLDMGFGPQVLSIRGGNTAGYNGNAAAIFGQTDDATTTMIVYASGSAYASSMIDVRCARSGHTAYKFAIFRSNNNGDTEFYFRGDGNAFADGSWNGGGADYAEYFEWADGNSSDEDRRGYTVVLDGNKIRKSTSSDSAATIIGVISGNPSMVGDNDINNWKQKYQKDDYGSYILDSDGERILNSDWDDSKEYVSREERKEWSIVGLMGKIRIRKGQTMGTNWIKMQDISDTVEEWLVR
tara:strand:- start:1053 stop:2627 length:1575 start_codon:yes stop_codon:yes gene_type:complete